jgi:hypothetical protein
LFCIPFLSLERQKSEARVVRTYDEDIQGLVLQFVRKDDEHDVHQRVGYFTTSDIKRSKEAREAWRILKEARVERVRLAGCPA